VSPHTSRSPTSRPLSAYHLSVRAADEASGAAAQHAADLHRGAPAADLSDYAAARGLEQRGNKTQVGWIAAFPMSEELQFNVLRGTLPGGEYGLLLHEAKMLPAGASGLFHGHEVKAGRFSWKSLLPSRDDFLPDWHLGNEDLAYFKAPCTSVAIRLPEATGALVGLQVGRKDERVIDAGGQWQRRDLDDLGLPDWSAAVRTRADQLVAENVLGGPISALLERPGLPLGFQVSFRYGTLIVLQQHFLSSVQQLDELATVASWLAGAIRQTVSAAAAEPARFATALAEPDWARAVRESPDATHLGGDGQDLGAVARIAAARGLAVEDPLELMRAFSYLPIPGEPFGALRGTLPGTSVEGRLVTMLERPVSQPIDMHKPLKQPIGGPFGCDAALIPATAPDTPGVIGEAAGDRLRVAVKQGVLAAWRPRAGARPEDAELAQLTADTVALATERGLL
jgi:hypothetical protein